METVRRRRKECRMQRREERRRGQSMYRWKVVTVERKAGGMRPGGR